MTYREEFVPEEEQGLEEGNYPTAFGITFTPQVSGIGLALVGLVGAIYILMNFAMPAWDNYSKLKEDETNKQQQVEQQTSGKLDKKLQDAQVKLQQAEALKAQVLAFFSNEKTLETLLLDLNRFFQARKVKLISFQPQGDITIISDSSLGQAVNNKLKRQSFNLEMEGSFVQTQALLRDLERLQPLLVLKNLNSQTTGNQKVTLINRPNQASALIPGGEEKLKTTLTLDVILPLTPVEVAKVAPPPAQPTGEKK